MDRKQVRRVLTEVNNKVKRRFTYVYDHVQFKEEEYWKQPDESYDGSQRFKGDCEDYALHCRKLLRERGVPTRLIFCELEGTGHIVLEASGYIIDNNLQRPITNVNAEKRGYKWMYISGFEPGEPWHPLS